MNNWMARRAYRMTLSGRGTTTTRTTGITTGRSRARARGGSRATSLASFTTRVRPIAWRACRRSRWRRRVFYEKWNLVRVNCDRSDHRVRRITARKAYLVPPCYPNPHPDQQQPSCHQQQMGRSLPSSLRHPKRSIELWLKIELEVTEC